MSQKFIHKLIHLHKQAGYLFREVACFVGQTSRDVTSVLVVVAPVREEVAPDCVWVARVWEEVAPNRLPPYQKTLNLFV